MLKLCRVSKVKVLFLVPVYVFNFNLFEFSAAILEKDLLANQMLYLGGQESNARQRQFSGHRIWSDSLDAKLDSLDLAKCLCLPNTITHCYPFSIEEKKKDLSNLSYLCTVGGFQSMYLPDRF